MKRIPTSACCNKCDVFVTCEGKVLKRNEEMRSCGVSDGCIVQVVNRMRGGGKHRNKKIKAEKKTTARPRDEEPERGQQEHNGEKIIQNLLSREDAENEVIRRFEENEKVRKTIARLMERWILIYTEVTGLDGTRGDSQPQPRPRSARMAGAIHGKKNENT